MPFEVLAEKIQFIESLLVSIDVGFDTVLFLIVGIRSSNETL